MSKEAKVFQSLLALNNDDFGFYVEMFENDELSKNSYIYLCFQAMLALAED